MDALQQSLTTMALVAAALAGLGYLTRQVWRGFQVIQRIERILSYELTPNGGGSLRDDLTHVAQAVGDVQGQVGDLQGQVVELTETKRVAHELLQRQLDALTAQLLEQEDTSRHRKGT